MAAPHTTPYCPVRGPIHRIADDLSMVWLTDWTERFLDWLYLWS